MSRARSKKELLEFGEEEFSKLEEHIKRLEEEKKLDEYIFDNRKMKDILAHLYAWHELFFNWYTKGMNNEKVEIPAPGYTFKTAPELNEKLYQDYKDMDLEEIIKKLRKSHKKIMQLVEDHSEKELFTKKKYKWTGTTSMGSYFASAISSHYNWANNLFKKLLTG